jgi:hypothetical protein
MSLSSANRAMATLLAWYDAQSAKIEAGAVHLPHHAPWLDDLRSEILAFPRASVVSALFESLSQFHVACSDAAHLFSRSRIMKRFGSGQDFFGACSQIARERQ